MAISNQKETISNLIANGKTEEAIDTLLSSDISDQARNKATQKQIKR